MKTLLAVFFTLAVCASVQASVNWSRIHPALRRLPEQKVTGKQYEARLKSIQKWKQGLDPLIVGGKPASAGQFPYQVAVNIDAGYFCGGSIISQNYVITAAHCGVLGNSFTLYLGSTNIKDPSEPTRQTIISRNVVVHERYNSNTLANDIAILKLWSPCDFNDYVQPIALPMRSQESESFTGKEVTASGWGKLSDGSSGVSSKLQYTPLTVIANDECAMYYGDIITISQICAVGKNKESTCNGDSGGPLALSNNGKPLLVGVISFVSGAGCESGYPSGYTRVTTFLDWIQSNSDITIG